MKISNFFIFGLALLATQKMLWVDFLGSNLSIFDICVIALAPFMLFCVLHQSPGLSFRWLLFVYFFFFVASMNLIFAIDFNGALKNFISLLMKIASIALVIYVALDWRSLGRVLNFYYRSMILIVVLFALPQFYAGEAIVGPFANRNEMLMYTIPASIMSACFFIMHRGIVDFITLVASLFVIFISRGRAGVAVVSFSLVAVVFLLYIYIPEVRAVLKKWVKLSSFVFFLSVVFAGLYLPDLILYYYDRYLVSAFNEIEGGYGSFSHREVALQGVWASFMQNPFLGIGLGGFRAVSGSYADLSSYGSEIMPHNTYAGLLSEAGLLGFFVFIVFLIVPFKVVKLKFISSEWRFVILALRLSFFSTLLFAVTYDSFNSYVIWLQWAFLYAASSLAKKYHKIGEGNAC